MPPTLPPEPLDLACFRESFLASLEPETQSFVRGFSLYLGGLADEDRLRRGDLEGLGAEEVAGARADLDYAGRLLGMMAAATLEAPASRGPASGEGRRRKVTLELWGADLAHGCAGVWAGRGCRGGAEPPARLLRHPSRSTSVGSTLPKRRAGT